jgi:hypothetical protein
VANFDSGVSGYVTATAIIEVNFPIDNKGRADIRCKQCPFLSSNERICQLNKEVVAYPQQYVGQNCPLKEENEVSYV